MFNEEQESYLFFSMNHWEDLWQSRHYVASEMAKSRKVLFVSPPPMLSEIVTSVGYKEGFCCRSKNLFTFAPWRFLFTSYRFPRLSRVVQSVRRSIVRSLMKKLNFRTTILFLWHPMVVDEIGRYSEELICYYLDEDFTKYYRMSDKSISRILRMESELLRRADLVFVNGSALIEEKGLAGRAIDVPMGVDFERFNRVLTYDVEIPSDLARIPSPRIGYVGNVNDKVDFDLLREIAAARPHWSIVLIGPENVHSADFKHSSELLKNSSNVYFLGAKEPGMIPACIKSLDVCLMCYRTDGWARLGYPLKIHEYLAVGKPVVSSDLPSIRHFDDVIRIRHSPKDWILAIQAELVPQNPSEIQKRISVARENDWASRVEVIYEAVRMKLLEKRNNKHAVDGATVGGKS